MAAAKKRTTAKRTVKYAAKAQSAATHAAVKTARDAAKNASYWTQKGAQDWQKNAQDWMQQSSQLLHFPQGDLGAASQQAAEQMKSATETAMKASSDMMSKLFGGHAAASPFASSIPQFDASAVQEKMTSFARESTQQAQKSAESANRAATEAYDVSRENIETLVEVANHAVTVSKEVGAELISYLNKSFSQNVELSKQVLSCRTLNDMFDLSTRIMKTNLEAYFIQSVKLSELLFQSANEISEPLNERMAESTERLNKAFSA